MTIEIFISSLIISFLMLIPISIKWKIRIGIGAIASLFIGGTTGVIFSQIYKHYHYLSFGIIIVFVVVSIFLLTVFAVICQFYRDPERKPAKEGRVIVSPADGIVLYIREIQNGIIPVSIKRGQMIRLNEFIKTDLLKKNAFHIGIEMNVLNVHVNRAPIGGKIVHQNFIRGKFLSLKNIEYLFTNERVVTIIDNELFKVGMIQIASRLVRRIVAFLNEGEKVLLGQRIGMIKFGSQVDLIIPKKISIKICIKQGDQVKAGNTIIAEY